MSTGRLAAFTLVDRRLRLWFFLAHCRPCQHLRGCSIRDMAYPEKLLSKDEKVVTEFRPHWQAILIPILLLVVALALVVIVFQQADGTVAKAVAGGILLVWLVMAARRLAIWATTKYVITTERVIVRSGVFSRRGKEIPLEVINDVAFNQSLFERIVKSGDLLIESAGQYGQSRYTDIPHPETLQSLIYQVREKRIYELEGHGGVRHSVADEIAKLAELRDKGDISDEEFEQRKRKLIDS